MFILHFIKGDLEAEYIVFTDTKPTKKDIREHQLAGYKIQPVVECDLPSTLPVNQALHSR